MRNKSVLIPFFVLGLVAALAHLFHVTQSWGAHPFWSTKVLLIGVPIGAGLAIIASLRSAKWASVGFLIATIVAYRVATLGKARFAASYAEDAVAGQMWFWGWIGTCAMASALIFAVVLWRIAGQRV